MSAWKRSRASRKGKRTGPFEVPLEVLLAGLASVAVALLATATALTDVLPMPVWLTVTLAIALALLTAILELRRLFDAHRRARKEREAHIKQVREALASGFWPPPRLRDVDPFDAKFGVFASKIANRYRSADERPPYVKRDVDAQLDRALDSKQLIVVAGPARAGKSRTAFEALLRALRDSQVVVPASPFGVGRVSGPLSLLANADPPLELEGSRPVLWLDEVDRYLEHGDFNLRILRQLQTTYPGLLAIATIRDRRLRELEASGAIGHDLRVLLHDPSSALIELEASLSDREQARALAVYPGLADDPVFKSGIGGFFTATEELIKRYRNAQDNGPVAFAVVQAAIDWRRGGMERPITRDELRELAGSHLLGIRADLELTDESFEEALRWACAPVVSSAALLRRVKADGGQAFAVYDDVVEWMETQGHVVSSATLEFILARGALADAFAVGMAAYRLGRREEARRLWTRLATSPLPAAARAALQLGMLAAEDGDTPTALRAYQQALDSRDQDAAPEAALQLGDLAASQGASDQALAAWQQALAFGHPNATPLAALRLGELHEREGRDGDAEAAWKVAVDQYPHPEATARAALRLGRLYVRRGRLEDSIGPLEVAVGHDVDSAEAPAALADARARLGQWDLALGAAWVAVDRDPGHAGARYAAAIALICLGRAREAWDLTTETVQTMPAHPWGWDARSQAALALGQLEHAHRAAEHCRELRPNDALGHLALCRVSLATGWPGWRLDEARQHAEAAVRLAPRSTEALGYLAYIEQHSQQYSEAIYVYDRILQLDPTDQRVRAAAVDLALQVTTFTPAQTVLELVRALVIPGYPLAAIGTIRAVKAWAQGQENRRMLPPNIVALLRDAYRRRWAESRALPLSAACLLLLGGGLLGFGRDDPEMIQAGLFWAILAFLPAAVWLRIRWLVRRGPAAPSSDPQQPRRRWPLRRRWPSPPQQGTSWPSPPQGTG
jgi:tetratricopeptide (TPR) repeat protein